MSNELLISPEGLDIANAYLENQQDATKTASALNMSVEVVANFLEKSEVKRYIDRVFMEAGYRNRDKMSQLWDAIIEKKIEEMAENEIGSAKDIVEILQAAQKFKMQEVEIDAKLSASKTPAIQINSQTNNNYNQLIEKLLDES